ncbi:MAG: hypothetical protein K8S99_14750 [Planctomycetes bacterium]|nr:hypothetical protein [Planctomycetota bacterium]
MTYTISIASLRADLDRLRVALHEGEVGELEIIAVRIRTVEALEQSRGQPIEHALVTIEQLLGDMQRIVRAQSQMRLLCRQPVKVA